MGQNVQEGESFRCSTGSTGRLAVHCTPHVLPVSCTPHVHKCSCSRGAAGITCPCHLPTACAKTLPPITFKKTPRMSSINQNDTHPQAHVVTSMCWPAPLVLCSSRSTAQAAISYCRCQEMCCHTHRVARSPPQASLNQICPAYGMYKDPTAAAAATAISAAPCTSGTANANIPSHQPTGSCCWLLVVFVAC